MEAEQGGGLMLAPAQRDGPPAIQKRLSAMAIGVVVLSGILCLRLWQLQIIEGADFAAKAENNRLDYEVLKSPRGIIYGRGKNIVLADNRAACDLVMTPALMKDVDKISEEWPKAAQSMGGSTSLLCAVADITERGGTLDDLLDTTFTHEPDRAYVEALLPPLKSVRKTCDELSRIVSMDPNEQLLHILDAVRRGTPFEQIPIREDISKTERMRLEEHSFKFQGVYTVARPQRRYNYGDTAGQILGWFNEISEDEYEKLRPRYKLGDIIGRDGIELAYEDQLKGTDGAMIVSRYNGSVPQLRTDERGIPFIEIDSKGRSLSVEERHNAVPGKPIFTTLDVDLQRRCEEILKHDLLAEDIVDTPAEGAIVAMNADTGEILALASVPTYDPNIFATSSPDRAQIVRDLMRDPEKPMLNRAFQTHYYPGSTFKVLMAIAALEEGVIDEHTTFHCGGSFMFGGRAFKCWRHSGHGSVNVVDALAFSCDVFFYNVGQRLGADKLEKWATKLGIGVKTGIDLPREEPGFVANPAKKAAIAKAMKSKNPDDYKWYPGDMVSMSIGQGMVDTTILQNAVLMATVLNGGKRVRPFINLELGPQVSEQLVSGNTIRLVRDGMFKCVDKTQPPSGTGRLAKIEGLEVLGKTGTAQIVSLAALKGRKEREIPYDLRDNALFIGGVANMKPRLAVSVIVEHGLHGSSTAAPVARKVFDYFYRHEAGTDGTSKPLSIAMYGAASE